MIYKHNFKEKYLTKFKYNKNFYGRIFESSKTFSLNSITINYTKNENNTFLECKLFFKDFDLILNLKKEKFTYRFFYLFECLADIIFYFVIGYVFSKKIKKKISKIFHIFVCISSLRKY
jgi:prolipoprotein diacylglyceryltransferase